MTDKELLGAHCYDCRHFDPSVEAANNPDNPNEWGWCKKHLIKMIGAPSEKARVPERRHKDDWCKDLELPIDLIGQLQQRQKWAKMNLWYHDANESYYKGMIDAYDCTLILAERQREHLLRVINTLEKLTV